MLTKLFIYGFPKGKEDLYFKMVFSQFGEVVSVDMVKTNDLSQNPGYGFIVMQSIQMAELAINALNNTHQEGTIITVRLAVDFV